MEEGWYFVYKATKMAEGVSPFIGFKKCEVTEAAELSQRFSLRRMKGKEEETKNLVKWVTDLEKERSVWRAEKEDIKREWKNQAVNLEKKLLEVSKEKEELRTLVRFRGEKN